MGSLRGRWSGLPRAAFPTAVMPTYHPAFLLRSYTKENREKVWSDLQKVMERLGLAANSTVPG
jgi:DNA polymerase